MNVVITGTSSGFGKATALRFARDGARVFATMRDPSRGCELAEIAAREKLPLEILRLDVTDGASVTAAIAEILARAGTIDVLVNNAGIGNVAAFEDMFEDELRAIVETNFFGAVRVTRAVLPAMRARRSGVIVMVSSLSGLAPTPGESAYVASKFALEGASEALAYEVERFGIRVAIVEPGFSRTGMCERANVARACPEGSPYRELVHFLDRRQKRSEAAGDDPEIVVDAIVEAVRSEAPPLRRGVGAMAPLVVDGRRQLDEAAWMAATREEMGFAWWSRGERAPQE